MKSIRISEETYQRLVDEKRGGMTLDEVIRYLVILSDRFLNLYKRHTLREQVQRKARDQAQNRKEEQTK